MRNLRSKSDPSGSNPYRKKKRPFVCTKSRFHYGRRVGPETGKQSGELFSVDGNGNITAADRQCLNGTVKFPVTEAELLSECETYGARATPRVRTHIAKKNDLSFARKAVFIMVGAWGFEPQTH